MALIEPLLLGFGVGLSGAIAPGPTLLATVSGAARHGPFVGVRVAAGHLAVEGTLALALLFGVAPLIVANGAAIAVVGGAALAVFGLLTLRSSRRMSRDHAPEETRVGPFLAGALTSVANPYFWLWWATLGGALLAGALATGAGAAALFLAGHGAADVAWLFVVGAAVARGSSFLRDRGYRALLAGCGIAMTCAGIAFVASAF